MFNDMDMSTRVQNIDFYALHGIWGAYSSLALGRTGRGAGVVAGNVQPPAQGLFIGYKTGHEEAKLLPFVNDHAKNQPNGSAYNADDKTIRNAKRLGYSWFTEDQIERSISLSGERWHAGALSFTVTSFFGSVPDPATVSPYVFRSHACPILLLHLDFDNRQGAERMTGYFGMTGINRPLSDATEGRLLGMAKGVGYGFAVLPKDSIQEVMDWNSVDAAFNGTIALRRLASQGGLRFQIEAGCREEYVIALGVYADGIVTAGIPMHRYYTCLFKDLEEVLEFALENTPEYYARAGKTDALLQVEALDDDQRFLIAQAAHSYNANTELLMDSRGNPVFLVGEGEYQMINTLDLTVDQAYWELCFSPWTLRTELDFLLSQSTYHDTLGIAFSHDQGVADCFTPKGHSSYELPGLLDCFSYMSYEETLNWVLSACLYAHNTQDVSWAENKIGALLMCLSSLLARDQNGDGIMDADSDRCEGGSEITTYDSLDISLGQARNNLYLAIKAWGTFICLAAFLTRHGKSKEAARSEDAARAIAETVCRNFIVEEGYIPAVFEGGNRSRIIPAIEGLIYPYLAGATGVFAKTSPYAGLIDMLGKHLQTILVPGVCIDAVSGGWKLSSTSRNTWLSKIFLNQFVARQILGFPDSPLYRSHVYAGWLQEASADFAATDQVNSSDGKDLGSRLYPRLVTSLLWLLPHHRFEGLLLPDGGLR
jgi:hypothetical protein